MQWTDLPTGQTHAAFGRFMVALGDEAEVAVTRINTDPVFTDRLAQYSRKGAIESPTSHGKAREIMGSNFFGAEEAMKHFGVNPSRRHLAMLAEVPFPEETLETCKNTHVLVAVFPLSIVEIRDRVKSLPNQTLFYNQDWYNQENFANSGEVGWYLLRKEPIANSTSKTWDEQQELLSEDEVTPSAQVMVYTMIGHFLATGERLFEKVYVRCSDLASGGLRVRVGAFDAGGLIVYRCWDDNRRGRIGVSSARK